MSTPEKVSRELCLFRQMIAAIGDAEDPDDTTPPADFERAAENPEAPACPLNKNVADRCDIRGIDLLCYITAAGQYAPRAELDKRAAGACAIHDIVTQFDEDEIRNIEEIPGYAEALLERQQKDTE